MITTEVKKYLTLGFDLPGVEYSGRSGHGGETQLESPAMRGSETWYLKVHAGNVRATAERLREVAGELDKAAEVLA